MFSSIFQVSGDDIHFIIKVGKEEGRNMIRALSNTIDYYFNLGYIV